ncbi:50S ribosomal protein L15 [Candidatus Beckwithbacteria bacterium RBG_13_42_9]|uniref:Large ribosomal subunit protein uL15 n=1 Tax=Candidatus Beckwithbacteria bacterium RBG_13_42_9 TaxID=1797457 RepID=A0A1F5E8U8_9BACT|nr:MAG: 50S ribosomal protein L15 [Candidatus Beckwithbacteria bacterium RBG_13_42_9]
MKLFKLPKTTDRGKKRIGRGYGSGKGGHTSSRGQKGQKTRGKVKLMFEGTKARKSLVRRLPMLRGKRKLITHGPKPVIIKLQTLETLGDNTQVTIESLAKFGLLKSKEALTQGVKILGKGKLTKKLEVLVPVSLPAKKIIERAGGTVSQGN